MGVVWFWLASISLGAVPDGVRPVMAAPDTPERFSSWASDHGLEGRSLPCARLVPDALLMCFRLREGKTRRWVRDDDLERWGVDLRGLLTAVTERSKGQVAGSGVLTSVQGMDARYWLGASGSGWQSAVFLAPGEVARALETQSLVVAAPSRGVVLAWGGGDPELDLVMTVGAREMFERQEGPVSEQAFRWDRGTWSVYGRAFMPEKLDAP